jgi:serine/threonine-protein kinase
VRESCADNSLLAECADPEPAPGAPVANDNPAPSREPSQLELARAAAENVLRSSCGRCHGPELSLASARAGMNYIEDIDELVANEKITPLDSANSAVVRRMLDGSMPPVGTPGSRPSSQDIAVVANFIDDPLFWPGFRPEPSCEGQRLPLDQLYREVRNDLRSEDSEQRPFLRYLSLSPRYDAGVCSDELDRDRFAMSKLLNMLSTRAQIRAPRAVNRDRTIYRIDLRDYGWNRPIQLDGRTFNDGWEAIIGTSPYAIPFVGDEADDIRGDALTDVAILNFDAMLDVAAIGNLYYALIDVDVESPLSDFVLAELGIDLAENLRDGNAMRAGTTRSQISRQDRVLERHEMERRRGVYWQSFDFAANDVGESIFSDPLGFNPGGTEAIFTLPNGLLAFIIADDDDNIVAESNILFDTFQDDFVARTSVSCSSCHAQGFNPVVDEVAPYVLRNPIQLGRDNVQGVQDLYPTPEVFARAIVEDSRRYQQSLTRAGAPLTGSDPVANAFVRFNLDVDLKVAAAELGVTTQLLERTLNLLDPSLAVLRSVSLDRDSFTAVFEASLCRLHQASENQPDPERCAAALAALED